MDIRNLTDGILDQYESLRQDKISLERRVKMLESALHLAAWTLDQLGSKDGANQALAVYRGESPDRYGPLFQSNGVRS